MIKQTTIALLSGGIDSATAASIAMEAGQKVIGLSFDYGQRHLKELRAAETLAKDLIITAKTKNNIIMGIQHKIYNVHGVQFHPESIKTRYGLKILKNFIMEK